MTRKNLEATERRIEKRETKQRQKCEKDLKQQKNEAAYRAWCEKARNRPRTAPNSFGYCAGKLRGSFDYLKFIYKEITLHVVSSVITHVER